MIKNQSTSPQRCARWLAVLACSVLLAACGGGGGNPGSTTGVGTGGSTTPPAANPTLVMSIVDGSGATITSLSGGQSATVKVKLTDSLGAIAPAAIVNFAASDTNLVSFTPVSGSALTDATGVAVITIKPTSATSAGAVSITATATVSAKTATASANIAVGAAPLTIGTLSLNPVQVGKLPAFSTVSLNIPITSGGQPATSVTGLNLNSLCVGDGTATLVPGALANGVQTATYTNNGCLRGNDTITVSIGTSSQSIALGVDAANIGTIQFVGSDLQGTSIVLKGSGGLGRKEAALLTFRVIDQNNNGLAGVDVSFSATTYTGGLTVAPTKGTTDATGKVTTTVSSGTIPTPVRVIAEATRNGKTISGLSDALTISTGLPIQKSMSMSADSYNIEGGSRDGEIALITVRLADQYGNPISDSTAVNFVTEGGAVGSSAQGACTTIDGGCSVQFRSQAFRPLNGRVTVLAYVQGIEDFIDSNGDGQYSCTNFVDSTGKVPATYRPLVDTCVSGGEPFTDQGDPFLDTGLLGATSGVVNGGTLDGLYEPANGDLPIPYNHVGYRAVGDGKWGINYISRSIEIVFSGSEATLMRQVCVGATCRDWNSGTDGVVDEIVGVAGPSCSSQELVFRLYDSNNNPLPRGTTVATIDADKLGPQTMTPGLVGSTNSIGGTIHRVTIKPDTACAPGVFSVKVATPGGTGSVFKFKSK
ncbi:MAG: Ig-like domain-containing protein [Pseudomonadota bacterium]